MMMKMMTTIMAFITEKLRVKEECAVRARLHSETVLAQKIKNIFKL